MYRFREREKNRFTDYNMGKSMLPIDKDYLPEYALLRPFTASTKKTHFDPYFGRVRFRPKCFFCRSDKRSNQCVAICRYNSQYSISRDDIQKKIFLTSIFLRGHFKRKNSTWVTFF